MCGDCGTVYPSKVKNCHKYLDDYLGVNNYADIEEAIHTAVQDVLDKYDDRKWCIDFLSREVSDDEAERWEVLLYNIKQERERERLIRELQEAMRPHKRPSFDEVFFGEESK